MIAVGTWINCHRPPEHVSRVHAFPTLLPAPACRATDGSRAAGADAISAVIGAEYKQSIGTFTVDVDAIGYGVDTTALLGYEGE